MIWAVRNLLERLRKNLSKITPPLGLDFEYYDTKSGVWLKDLSMPLAFRHLCGIHIPRSFDRIISSSPHPSPVMEGPQFYDIVASQSRCPSNTSIHEFTGYQRLLSGGSIRWLTMLVELRASNFNFSTEDTMHLFSHLTVQAGPARNDECLRQIHIVFRDEHFCERLAEQIGKCLRMIGDRFGGQEPVESGSNDLRCSKFAGALKKDRFGGQEPVESGSNERLVCVLENNVVEGIGYGLVCLSDISSSIEV